MAIESIDVVALFGSVSVLLSVTACTAGVGWRTWSKWYDKIREGENVPFDRKFLFQAIGSLVGSLLVALPLVTAGTEMINQWAGVYGLVLAWFLTAGWAYSVNDGANGIIKLLENNAINKAVVSGKLDKAIEQRMQVIQKEEQELKGQQTPQGTTSNTQTTTIP